MQFRYKISLETLADVKKFIKIITQNFSENEVLFLTDAYGNFSVNAKSVIGVLYSLEWDNLYLVSEKEVYHLFKDFIV